VGFDASMTATPDFWEHASYSVKVRNTVYLWGSAGFSANLSFANELVLHIRNDPFGETVTLGTQVAGGTQTILGTLDPGEVVSLPLQNTSGVFATCTLQS
jgi:hypothetical protein